MMIKRGGKMFDYQYGINKEELTEIGKDLIEEIGHEKIRYLYQVNRKINNLFHLHRFPISFFYRQSLFKKFEDDYSKLSAKEIASIEKVSEGWVYKLWRQFWIKKKDERLRQKD